MRITFDPEKYAKTLEERCLDFHDAKKVFSGHHFTWTDQRKDYGETRFITVGKLQGRMVILVWRQDEGSRRIISMRKANDREQAKYNHRMD